MNLCEFIFSVNNQKEPLVQVNTVKPLSRFNFQLGVHVLDPGQLHYYIVLYYEYSSKCMYEIIGTTCIESTIIVI